MSAISITKLYDLLCNKLGKETAENLTTFIENKINIGLESKTHILATKEDLAKATLATKEELSMLRENIATLATKEELFMLRENIATLATKEELSMLREHMATLATKDELFGLKEGFAKLTLSTKEDIAKLREDIVKIDGKIDSKIDRSKSEMVRWMFVFWASQMILTFGFVLLFLKK